MPRKRTDPLVRLAAQIGPGEICPQEWTGAVNADGYGVIGMTKPNGRWYYIQAHRLILILQTGEPGTGLHARHSCDNPRCVTSEHLLWGTPKDNVNDMIERGRARYVSGDQHGRWRGGSSRAYQRKQRRKED